MGYAYKDRHCKDCIHCVAFNGKVLPKHRECIYDFDEDGGVTVSENQAACRKFKPK